MTSERIKEIQEQTAYPESVSVQQALLQVWNECEQEQLAIQRVSQRSELLNGFRDWLIDERKNIHFYRHLIDDYLKTI